MKTITELQNQEANTLLKESTQNIKEYIIEVSNRAQAEGKDVTDVIDEGILGALVGGVIGGAAGKTIMQSICNVLGVREDSTLGKLLTSRMVLTAVGAKLGYSW